MQYKFYLDGTLMQENPIGWDAMLLKADRDTELKSVLIRLEATLTWRLDGYDYIKSIYDGSDYCALINISIHRSVDNGANFIERYKGLLFLSDMKFDDFNCSVTTEFVDDSFYGRVDKRRKTEAYLTGESTINGEALAACRIRPMSLFDPVTGIYTALTPNYGCYRVYEVLEYLISYMTDNEVEFSSPLFGSLGEFNGLMLTFGYAIRAEGNGNILTLSQFIEHLPTITFQKLFSELDKRFNIGFFVDLSGSKPKIVIDYWKELFKSNTLTTFPDLPNLKTEIAKELIYSSISFGGSKTYDAPAASFPETIRFIGFNSEKFIITGKCNIENELDLGYDYVSSSNVIQQILILSGIDETYDEDWFLIDCNIGSVFTGSMKAKQSNWLTAGPPYYYNESLTNYEISKRFLGFVPNSIALYLGNTDNSIFVTHSTPQSLVGTFQQIAFTKKSPAPYYDINNNWNTVGSFYTVPLTGIYSAGLKAEYLTIIPMHLKIVVERRDNADTTTLSETIIYENFNVPPFITTWLYIDAGAVFVANSTDLIKIKLYQTPNIAVTSFTTGLRSFPELIINNIEDGGGVYQTYDPTDYPIINNVFSTEIFVSQTDAIIADPLSQIAFYITAADTKLSWISELSIDEFKGTINANLLTSRGGGECVPSYGGEILIDADFPSPNLNWAEGGDVGVTFTFGIPGVKKDLPGTFNGQLTQIFTDQTSQVGIFKTIFSISGRTQGEAWVNIGSSFGTHRTADGTYIESLLHTGILNAFTVYMDANFDGVITITSLKAQLNC